MCNRRMWFSLDNHHWFSREGKSEDSFVRYIQVMPTFQLGPRCQLELGGASTRHTLGVWPGVPATYRAGRDPEKSFLYALFTLGADAPLAKEVACAHFGCALK